MKTVAAQLRLILIPSVLFCFVLRADPLDGQTNPDLRIAISIPSNEFKVGEPIDWTVTLTNVSPAPLRVVKPDWYFVGHTSPAPAAEFVIERDDGRVARPMPKCMGDNIGDTADKVSVMIAAGASLATRVGMLACWSYTFGSEPIRLQEAILAPKPFPAGRYRVFAKYGFRPGAYSQRWWAFVGSRTEDRGQIEVPPLRAGEPWHGEITSNIVEVTVK